MKDWSTPESWRWNSCCNWPWRAVTLSISSGSLTVGLKRNLTKRWSRPETKKITARIMIKSSILGLTLSFKLKPPAVWWEIKYGSIGGEGEPIWKRLDFFFTKISQLLFGIKPKPHIRKKKKSIPYHSKTKRERDRERIECELKWTRHKWHAQSSSTLTTNETYRTVHKNEFHSIQIKTPPHSLSLIHHRFAQTQKGWLEMKWNEAMHQLQSALNSH